jgi:hypothetical protein
MRTAAARRRQHLAADAGKQLCYDGAHARAVVGAGRR